MTELKLGIYRHYKGPMYQVFGIARDANAEELFVQPNAGWCYQDGDKKLADAAVALKERIVVVYQGLQLDGAHPGHRMVVRTFEAAEMDSWEDWVQVSAEEGERRLDRAEGDARGYFVRHVDDGWWVPRFEYLGQEMTEAMLDG